MLGRIISAIAGNKASEYVRGVDGTAGTLLGFAAPTVLRRMGPLGIVAAVAGGYAYKKHAERRDAQKARAQKARAQRPSGFAEPTRMQA
ncbi:hypothetical protein [Novosphingobium resinovorum]|jgi:hypothetical protein|uniref:Uncharacterized protein n=1 Tax=Novosphingobium resinovorum TaxID=158500 RepID=A0A1D8ADX3_9SPHN|nr:hypothetical protein [Novosphingobium resinovorum]AOR80316.1 hypothetical protein BES08_25820 [Novosphingobium resinovorum]